MPILKKLIDQKPLILNLTNSVTADFVANALLAIGAAPIMSEAKDELEELTHLVHAIVINTGTLHQNFIARARFVIQLAKQYNKPIILDPVGCGATHLRTKIAREFLPFANIVRGNASEIIALLCDEKSYGVESQHPSEQAFETAKILTQKTKATFVITGKTDYVVHPSRHTSLSFGAPIMKHITGMGCALSAVVAAFHAVESDAFTAALHATEYYSFCGQKAAENHQTPGSFKVKFLDFLFEGIHHSEEETHVA